MPPIKVHHTATDNESAWDGPGEVAKAPEEEATLRYMHAWVDPNADPNTKTAYKFPHHKAGSDTAANINGVNNALSRLPQANIPEGDRAGVEAHLQAHRDDAGLNESALAAPLQEGEENTFARKPSRSSYVLNAFIQTPWAIVPYKLAILSEIVARHVAGEKLDPEEVQMRIHGAKRPADGRVGNIAVLPLFGVIFPRANLMTDISGATSAERFGMQFDELIKDPQVGAIVLDVDSPGGQVAGIEELSRQIYEARGKKPIVAVANHEMNSAAYFVGSAADEIVITPSGEVGSIGVWAAHDDISAALAQSGVKRTLISAGKYKTEGNPWEPLTEEAHSAIQLSVNESYDAFVKSVARNRGVKMEQVRNGFGEGRSVGAKAALELGMADRIDTLSETIKRLRRSILTLSKEQQTQAEDLRMRVNSILRKEH